MSPHATGQFSRANPATGVRTMPGAARPSPYRTWLGVSKQYMRWLRAEDREGYRARMLAEHDPTNGATP